MRRPFGERAADLLIGGAHELRRPRAGSTRGLHYLVSPLALYG
jgi:hypothetical protein